MMVLARICLLALIPAACGPARTQVTSQAAAETPAQLDGGFIGYWNNMMNRPEAEWCAVLRSMKAVGMNTVIVQRLAYRNNADQESTLMSGERDPTSAILRCAATERMQVYVGLWDHPAFSVSGVPFSYFRMATEKSLALLDSIERRGYAGSGQFAGCYVSLEPSNFRYDRDRIDTLRAYFRRVSDRCKSLRPDRALRVAAAAYFNPGTPGNRADWLASAQESERVYRELLSGSGLDILMVQDGVGVRTAPGEPWYGRVPEFMAQVDTYFSGFSRAASAATPKVTLWSDVEIFEGNPVGSASWSRVLGQLTTETPHVQGGSVIAFDFYHYMNPCIGALQVDDAPLARGEVAARVTLYRSYAQALGVTGPRCDS
jgi:hypothetical protein